MSREILFFKRVGFVFDVGEVKDQLSIKRSKETSSVSENGISVFSEG